MTATGKNNNHPCFSCDLPDCDDASRKCGLRRALAAYERARVGKALTPEIMTRRRIAYRELRGSTQRRCA